MISVAKGRMVRLYQYYSDEWLAVDDNRYDGLESPVGHGKTASEAIENLLELYEMRDGEEEG